MRRSSLGVLVVVGLVAASPSPSGAWALASGPRPAASTGGQVAELAGFDTVSGDGFGWSTGISGNIIVVGAPNHGGDAGRAYVFTKSPNGKWHSAGELVGLDTGVGDNFGLSVAISGSTIAVGAPFHASKAGRAYVFTKIARGWKQTAELVGSDTVAGDNFGWSVALSGDTLVVGACGHASGAGRAYVFAKSPTGWHQATELGGTGTTRGSHGFGRSVAISGNTLVVGAYAHIAGPAQAYVFTRGAPAWRQTGLLSGSGSVEGDNPGPPVAISGDRIVLGTTSPSQGTGRAYLFVKSTGGWHRTAVLTNPTGSFGMSAAVSGPSVVVANGLVAYTFTSSATGWRQTTRLATSNNSGHSLFGWSVAETGTTVVVGAIGASSGGLVYVFRT
jgi:hypothetical protein